MSPTVQAGLFLVKSLGSLYLFAILLRFLLQVARADFYNPITQFVVKATNPPLKPLRRIIPGVAGLDIASLVLALMVQLAAIYLSGLIWGSVAFNPIAVLLGAVIGTVNAILNIYFFALIIMVIASWVAPGSYHPALQLINQLIAPIMAPIHRLIPPLGGIDLSPIFAFMFIKVIQIFVTAVQLPVAIRNFSLGL